MVLRGPVDGPQLASSFRLPRQAVLEEHDLGRGYVLYVPLPCVPNPRSRDYPQGAKDTQRQDRTGRRSGSDMQLRPRQDEAGMCNTQYGRRPRDTMQMLLMRTRDFAVYPVINLRRLADLAEWQMQREGRGGQSLWNATSSGS